MIELPRTDPTLPGLELWPGQTPQARSRRPEARPRGTFLLQLCRRLLQHRRAMALIVAAAGFEAALATASPWIAAQAIDAAIPNAASHLLAILTIATVAITAHAAWAAWLHARTSIVLQQTLSAESQMQLMQAYLGTNLAELQAANYGATALTFSAASAVAQSVVRSATAILTQGAVAIAASAMLMHYHWQLALTTLAITLTTGAVATALAARERQHAARNMGAVSQARQLLYTLLSAVTTLRALRVTQRFVATWRKKATHQASQAIAMDSVRIARGTLVATAQQTGALLATLWLVPDAVSGLLSVGALTTCTLLVSRIQAAGLGALQESLTLLVLWPATARIDDLRARAGIVQQRAPAAPRQRAASYDIRVENVWYRYERTTPWALRDFTRTFPGGRSSLLQASSGAGKSTLLRLCAGLLEPEHGRVLVCGENPAKVRGLVAYVPQRSVLLDMTIAGNLKTLSGGQLERARELARLTGLDDVLAKLPMGAETLVTAGGSSLSAGQRQLIVLTAACATPHPVLLLDEPTSQLDEHSRAKIRWSELLAGRTVILVRHE